MTQKKKNRVGTSVAAVVAASAVAVGGAFGDAAEIMDEPPESIVEIIETVEDLSPEEDGESEKGRRSGIGLRARFLALPQAVRALLLLPLWVLGRGILIVGSSVLSVLQEPLIHALVNLLLVFGMGAALHLVLRPGEPLKNMLHRRRLIPMLAAWVLLCGADSLLPLVSEDYTTWRSIAALAVQLLVPVLLYLGFRVRKQRKTS